MTEVTAPEFIGTVNASELTMEKLRQWKEMVSADPAQRRALAAYVDAQAEAASRLRTPEKQVEAWMLVGALQWVLGRFEKSVASLEQVKRNELARRLQGDCYLQLGQYAGAAEIFAKQVAREATVETEMALVEALIGKQDLKEADKVLKRTAKKYTDQAEWHHQTGMLADAQGESSRAVAEYEKALELDPQHARALFRLAFHCDLAGDDEEALALYERCASVPPVRANTLMNLGLLYEDTGRYEEAVDCFRRVLAANPNDERARLYLKDAEASTTMYYDEEQERQTDRRNRVLEIPVTDFELSVRARNCLERMNVRTLGDLTHVTEQELLGCKNFGETSLAEVKQMLASKGLRLGQALEKETKRPKRPTGTTPAVIDVKSKPISELELSVRSRKCMQVLGIQTVGDLCEQSEDTLLGCKNFGQTSLTEIKQKLAELGARLREG